jgi:conjugative relaxase-like TrwC/TraI family protein
LWHSKCRNHRQVDVLTISRLKRWSINYYIDTAKTAERATRDLARAGGGLGEYYSERDNRTPTWLLSGNTHTVVRLVGLTDSQRAGGDADTKLVARWLDDGIAPNGAHGRAFGARGVHGFDLSFCAPKSVSLVRALLTDDVVGKAIVNAYTTALAEAMEYLAAHAGYTRVHNPRTGEKDLVKLSGMAAIAYQHETSRCGDPHLHTHVIVPNRQARADGQMVSIDGTSLYHEARAAGVIYQATLRRELHHSMGSNGCPSTRPPAWPSSLASAATRSPPGHDDRPSCASGRRTTSTSPTVRSRARSSPPRRKRPGQPNPKNSPGPSSPSNGAPTNAACTSTARHFTKPGRYDARLREAR